MFTAAVIATTGITLIVWLLMIFFDRELLHLLGSEGELMEIGLEYLKPLKAAIPVFIFSQMLAAFLRNDNDPGLATFAVVFTSLLNIAGDYLLTFTLNMGVYGAALATVLCNLLSVAIMLAHFLKKKNTLRFVLPKRLLPTRGLIVGGVMLYLLPALFGADSLWLAMPMAEISVAAVTGMLTARFTKGLDARG